MPAFQATEGRGISSVLARGVKPAPLFRYHARGGGSRDAAASWFQCWLCRRAEFGASIGAARYFVASSVMSLMTCAKAA
jgi:hypothetical protein